jgi:membrane protease YdiL (CAAX protease family)
MIAPSVSIRERSRALDVAAVAAALLLLVLRAYVPFGMPALVAVYLAMASLAVVSTSEVTVPRLLPPVAVVAIGFVAIWLAGRAGGTALPPAGVTTTAVTLNLLAAVGEEAFFRKFLYDRSTRWGPAVAIAITALVFSAVHVPAYGVAAFPVDLGAGILLGWQRWASGTWLAPAATHAFANLWVMVR